MPRPHPTSWPSCSVEIAALVAPYLLLRSSWSSRQLPNANECPHRAPRGQTRAHVPQSIRRHRGNREAHRRRARTAQESSCAAPALDQPSAAVASRGGPADCACAESRGGLIRDGCAIHRHANLELDWLHRSGPRIGLAGAHASAADRNAACEVAAAIVAATPRAGAALYPLLLRPFYKYWRIALLGPQVGAGSALGV